MDVHDETSPGVFGRLLPSEAAELTSSQQRLADQLHQFAVPFAEKAGFRATDEDGRLIGPWNAQLCRPELADGFNAWVAAEQANSGLAPEVREVAILATAVAVESEYEIYAHSAAAVAAGISQDVVAAIRAGSSAPGSTLEQHVARDFAAELATTHRVSDATYARAEAAFGLDVLIGLTHLIAIYLATGALLGAFAVGAPHD